MYFFSYFQVYKLVDCFVHNINSLSWDPMAATVAKGQMLLYHSGRTFYKTTDPAGTFSKLPDSNNVYTSSRAFAVGTGKSLKNKHR